MVRRVVCGRFFQTLAFLLAIALAWVAWWFWPERPTLELRLPEASNATVRVAPDGKAAHIASRSYCRLLSLPSCQDIIAPELVLDNGYFLNSSTIYLATFARGFSIVDCSNGNELFGRSAPTGHRCWSADGRIVAWVHDGQDEVHVFDTVKQHEMIMSGAKPPFEIEQTGQWMVTLLHDEPTAFAIWDVPSGRELRRCYSPNDTIIQRAEMSSDGRYVVTSAVNNLDEPRIPGATVLWDMHEYTDWILEELTNIQGRQRVGGGLFLGQSQWLLTMTRGQGFDLWNLAKRPLQPIRLPSVPFFDPTQRRYLLNEDRPDASAFSGPGSWVLCDAASLKEIARGPYARSKNFSIFENPLPNSKWFVVDRDRERSEFETKLLRLVGRATSDPRWLEIRSVETGRLTNRIPSDYGTKLAGITDDGHVWTHSSDMDATGEHSLVLHQWRAEARTPYWLFVLTIAVGFFCIRSWTRKQADRRIASVSALVNMAKQP